MAQGTILKARRTMGCLQKSIKHLQEFKIRWLEEGEINNYNVFIVLVEGIHSPIQEVRTEPSTKWYLHKFHGPVFSYKLALSIRLNWWLVWMKGNNRGITNSGYSGKDGRLISITCQGDSKEVKEFKARAKS
eukprot:jgi/Psemu1/18249/gm1.18249_g